jgi:arylsulfatase
MKVFTPRAIALATSIAFASIVSAQPNIIVIMVDDMGYSDLGCYGGEIDTPRLDTLAAGGLRLQNFRVTPMCVTSRISLLSGMDYHRAGRGNITDGLCFAYLLRDAGYQTSWTGKNHGLSTLAVGDPVTDFGFDNFYGFEGGATNNFQGDANWVENNVSLNFPASVPGDFYSTTYITTKAIEYMDQAVDDGEPFFSFVAFNAPHGPLQAPQADIDKYLNAGTYAAGWNQLRTERYDRMKSLGIIDDSFVLPDYGVEVNAWADMPDSGSYDWELNKTFEELSMATYAAMIDQIDQNIGRIVDYLEDPNGDEDLSDSILEDTLILFLADNGGVYAGAFKSHDSEPWQIGATGTNTGINTSFGWGMLMNTPFRYYKHSSHAGGIRSPLIAHWPNGISAGLNNSILPQSANIWDIYPTLLDVAGAAPYPTSYDPDNNPGTPNSLTPESLQGESFAPIFTDANSTAGSDTFISTYQRSSGYYENGWKVAHYADGPWELYNTINDPTERFDLRAVYPAKYQDLIDKWDLFRVSHPLPASGWATPNQSNKHRGWGFDQIRPGMLATDPEYMASGVPIDTDLTFTIDGTVDFNGSAGLYIRLQKFGSSDIIWEADPLPSHPSQGTSTITFTDLPILEPDTHYYITWDTGWFEYDGTNISRVNEAAFAYRFKTATSYAQTVTNKNSATPGSTVLVGDDIDGDGLPELANYLLATDTTTGETSFEVIFDETTTPPTPILRFNSPANPASAELSISHTDDLDTGFSPIYEVNGATASIIGPALETTSRYTYGDTTSHTLRLDLNEVSADQNFFRASATLNSGERPLTVWKFSKGSANPIRLSEGISAHSATTMNTNQGIVSSLTALTLPHPVFAWSGSDLPDTAIGVQIQTKVTAVNPMEITKIVYTGYAWSTRSPGTATTISADVVAFLDGVLDTPGIRAIREDIITVDGENVLKPFSITYELGTNSQLLSTGQDWELRARLQDMNATVYTLDEEGFGISEITIFGIEQ